MKKKITAICLCAALLAIAIVGGTLAYFTDTKTAENTFTMGNVRIVLDEADVNGGAERVAQNEYEVYPGKVVDKDPTVHNTGRNSAYLRARVTVSGWLDLVQTCYKEELAGLSFPSQAYAEKALGLLIDGLGEGWSVVGVEAGTGEKASDACFLLKYDGILAAGADTAPMFTKATIPAGLTNASADTFQYINVVAEAIQANGFDSWEAAFSAFDAG